MVPKICIPNVEQKWLDKTFLGIRIHKKITQENQSKFKNPRISFIFMVISHEKNGDFHGDVVTQPLRPTASSLPAFQRGCSRPEEAKAPRRHEKVGIFFPTFFFFEREKGDAQWVYMGVS